MENIKMALNNASGMKKNKGYRAFREKRNAPYLLLLPSLILIAVFMFYPIFNTFRLSTLNYVLTKKDQWAFIFLDNFKNLLFRDEIFANSLRITTIWTFGNVFLQSVLGLILALLLNQTFKGRGLYRALAFSPWAVAGILVSTMWGFMYNENFGVFNDLLMKAGIVDHRISWFSNETLALIAVMLSTVWRGVPFFAINFLAGLQSISNDIYESSNIDGVTAFKKFIYITLPLLKDTIVLTTLLRTIWTFNITDIIYGMTYGGPNNATLTVPVYIFKEAVEVMDYGYGSAIAVVMVLILMVFSSIYLMLSKFGEENLY